MCPTSNRNFEGRQGERGRTHLVSPIIAARSSIHGCLTSEKNNKMKEFIKGQVIPINKANIDTDIIIPNNI